MPTPPFDLITISREYGAGAGVLASILGERLGWRVLGDDMPALIARRLGLPDDAIVETDEHAASLLERVSHALIMGSPDVLVDASVARQPEADDVARITKEILLEAAQSPPVIIVGHGGQALFHRRPGTLRVRLVAPVEARAKLICERRACDEVSALRFTRRTDADRANWIREYFNVDVADPMLYHLVANTGLMDLDEVAGLVVQFVESRSRTPR